MCLYSMWAQAHLCLATKKLKPSKLSAWVWNPMLLSQGFTQPIKILSVCFAYLRAVRFTRAVRASPWTRLQAVKLRCWRDIKLDMACNSTHTRAVITPTQQYYDYTGPALEMVSGAVHCQTVLMVPAARIRKPIWAEHRGIRACKA